MTERKRQGKTRGRPAPLARRAEAEKTIKRLENDYRMVAEKRNEAEYALMVAREKIAELEARPKADYCDEQELATLRASLESERQMNNRLMNSAVEIRHRVQQLEGGRDQLIDLMAQGYTLVRHWPRDDVAVAAAVNLHDAIAAKLANGASDKPVRG